MSLRLYDTLRGEKVPFAPIGYGPIGLYVCGVTPYDTGHLGHAFTYLSFDVLHRYLEYLGHTVTYVQNLTDVDDDMLKRARQLGVDYLELGNRHVTTFLTEMAALNWLPPDHYPRATEHISQMQELIARLLEREHAYQADGYVYYAVDSWPDYGALSGLPHEAMLPIANDRGNVPDLPGKRDPLDFVLWQPSAPDEPSWPSPWGAGRPGWHIECSAMSIEYLGARFEIHGGGADLAFPHHEAERAQSEGATGARPFVSWWMHTGMLHEGGAKMSKSLGNLVLVRDLLRDHSGDAIRHYLVSSHYRTEVHYDADGLARSAKAAALLRAASARTGEPGLGDLAPALAEARDRFLAALNDDLDTPSAMVELESVARLALNTDDDTIAAQAGALVRELGGRILGLRLATVPERSTVAA